jgi:hypothetical protein
METKQQNKSSLFIFECSNANLDGWRSFQGWAKEKELRWSKFMILRGMGTQRLKRSDILT